MRKFLAVLLAVMLVMTASVTAFGATESVVKGALETAVDYALDGNYGKNGYTVDNAKYFLMYLKADEDAAKYEDKYLASVKKALDGGKLTGVTELGLTLEIMDLLGVNAKSFEGYDIVKMFKAADISDCAGSPYNYVYATEAAAAYGLDDFGKKICNYVIDNYYELGIGTDFFGGYGTSADDLSMFILALAPYADYFAQYIDNAFMLIKAYNSDEGYINYGEANTDSTALVLAAQSAMDNKSAADKTVDKLAGFYNESTGGFVGAYNDYYATADAIFALGYYLPLADAKPKPVTTTEATTAAEPETEPEETTKAPATEAPATEKAPETTTAAPAAPEKSPETGAANGAAIAFASIALAGAAVMLAKKKEK